MRHPAGNLRITRHPGRTKEYLFDHIPRLRCRQSFAEIGERPVAVSIENLAEELLLVAECSVKTWPIDAHRPGEIGKRSAFITFGPKNVHGAFERHVRSKARERPRRASAVF